METDFHPNTVIICTICSDAVIVRYSNAKTNMPDFETRYMLRLTSCYSCMNKIARSNMIRYDEMMNSKIMDTSSDGSEGMEEEMNPTGYAETFLPACMRLLEPFNEPIGTIMVASMPMYKRMMSYLSGNMMMKTINNFCVIEHLSMVAPELPLDFKISSIVVGLSKDTNTSRCGCANTFVKETVSEVPYEVGTFFAGTNV